MPDAKPKKGAVKQRKYINGDFKRGPAPARHIPWPEIFKHHQSVAEGHLRMLQMVQKHTAVGTPNDQMITSLVEKAKRMVWEIRDTARNFIPPRDHFGKVPIGSSSDSMYPGYSPGDVEYGEALQEAGNAIAEARQRGMKWEPPVEYELGQNKTGKKERYFAKTQDGSGSGSGSGSGGEMDASKSTAPAVEDSTNSDGNQYFVVDTEPTPVTGLKGIPDRAKKSDKRSGEGESDGKKSKKTKQNAADTTPTVPEPKEEFENIDAEVEARLKAKEERKKNKEKKRKRESDDSMIDVPPTDEIPTNDTAAEKPTKKKTKKEDRQGDEDVRQKKRKGEQVHEVPITVEDNAEGAKKKKRKKNKTEG